MAKTKKMVKQVLMSIVTLMSLTMALVEDFSRVTSFGGGFVEDICNSSEASVGIKK